jgi:hypothetical protein
VAPTFLYILYDVGRIEKMTGDCWNDN